MRRTISILIPPWGVDVARTNRREDANTDGTPLETEREKERERACYVAYVRACVRLFRARCYQRSCRFIPVLLPRHTCFREYGAGPRCARIFAARWNFVISIPGNPERVSLPSETSDTAVRKKEKKPRNASRVSARVFPRVACVAFLA